MFPFLLIDSFKCESRSFFYNFTRYFVALLFVCVRSLVCLSTSLVLPHKRHLYHMICYVGQKIILILQSFPSFANLYFRAEKTKLDAKQTFQLFAYKIRDFIQIL